MTAREVSFDSDGCRLAGTYAEAANPVAAALLITGSGKTDRDSDVRLPHDVMRIQGTRVNARWVRDFAAYDPRPVLARITVPVQAITGGEDRLGHEPLGRTGTARRRANRR